MTRETMMNEVVRKRGFEDSYSRLFCRWCEKSVMTNYGLYYWYRLLTK